MAKLTKSEQHIAEKTACILLMRGKYADGTPMYAYLAVRADRLEAFMEAQRNPGFNLEEWGVIIESGDGEPSEAVRQKMEEDYGFNHEAAAFLSSSQE